MPLDVLLGHTSFASAYLYMDVRLAAYISFNTLPIQLLAPVFSCRRVFQTFIKDIARGHVITIPIFAPPNPPPTLHLNYSTSSGFTVLETPCTCTVYLHRGNHPFTTRRSRFVNWESRARNIGPVLCSRSLY